MAPVLEVSHLARSYRANLSLKKYWILRDLSFSVEQGEIFGFIGPNGAGKTTTIKLIMDLVSPDAGSIRILGEPHQSVAVKKRLGSWRGLMTKAPMHSIAYGRARTATLTSYQRCSNGLRRCAKRAFRRMLRSICAD